MITPELKEEVYNCIKCGLCLTPCPVYKQLWFEGASPRGKVQLIKKILEGKLEAIGEVPPAPLHLPPLRNLHGQLPQRPQGGPADESHAGRGPGKVRSALAEEDALQSFDRDRLLPFFLFWGRALQTPVRTLLPKEGEGGHHPLFQISAV